MEFLVGIISENLLKSISLMFETKIFSPFLVWILRGGTGGGDNGTLGPPSDIDMLSVTLTNDFKPKTIH